MGVSMAVPQTSPSPCAAWPSPRLKRAPGTCTGSQSRVPAVRWRVSMLPPASVGGMVLRGSPGEASPSTPQKGARGMRTPGRNSPAAVCQPGDAQGRIRELVGQQAEARDAGRPAPVGRLELQQLDLQRVARLRAFHDRPVHRPGRPARSPASGCLPPWTLRSAGRTRHPGRRTRRCCRGHAQDRRDRGVPAQVVGLSSDVGCHLVSLLVSVDQGWCGQSSQQRLARPSPRRTKGGVRSQGS